MNRTMKIVGGAALLAVLAWSLPTLSVFAQQERRGGMMRGPGQHESKPMMMRTRMLMSMHVNPFDPNAVLALKDQLNLTDDQVKQLDDIASTAREKVQALLSSDQQAELKTLEKTPDTSMAMHAMMMNRMHGAHGETGMQHQGGGESSEGCPMMQMMKNMHNQS